MWRSNKFWRDSFFHWLFFFLPSIIVCTGSYIYIKINPCMCISWSRGLTSRCFVWLLKCIKLGVAHPPPVSTLSLTLLKKYLFISLHWELKQNDFHFKSCNWDKVKFFLYNSNIYICIYVHTWKYIFFHIFWGN